MVRCHVTVQGLCEREATDCFTDLKDNIKEFQYFYKLQSPHNTNFCNIRPTLLNGHEMKVHYSLVLFHDGLSTAIMGCSRAVSQNFLCE
jgi:hypothetical protein